MQDLTTNFDEGKVNQLNELRSDLKRSELSLKKLNRQRRLLEFFSISIFARFVRYLCAICLVLSGLYGVFLIIQEQRNTTIVDSSARPIVGMILVIAGVIIWLQDECIRALNESDLISTISHKRKQVSNIRNEISKLGRS